MEVPRDAHHLVVSAQTNSSVKFQMAHIRWNIWISSGLSRQPNLMVYAEDAISTMPSSFMSLVRRVNV